MDRRCCVSAIAGGERVGRDTSTSRSTTASSGPARWTWSWRSSITGMRRVLDFKLQYDRDDPSAAFGGAYTQAKVVSRDAGEGPWPVAPVRAAERAVCRATERRGRLPAGGGEYRMLRAAGRCRSGHRTQTATNNPRGGRHDEASCVSGSRPGRAGVVSLASSRADVVLVKDGNSNYTIGITRDEAVPAAHHAARELQAYIEKMSGATLPIYQGGDRRRGPLQIRLYDDRPRRG